MQEKINLTNTLQAKNFDFLMNFAKNKLYNYTCSNDCVVRILFVFCTKLNIWTHTNTKGEDAEYTFGILSCCIHL